MKKRIKKAAIDHLIKAAIKNIKMHYRQNKDKAGWHQFLGSEKIGTIATATALLSFKYFKEDFNDKLKIEESLLNSQIRNPSNSKTNGGWGYVTNFPGMATTEATCLALLALQEGYSNHPNIQAGLNWLLNNIINRDADEGWGILPGDISRVYTTCLALKTLKAFGRNNTYEYERGLNWLIRTQNADKGWGSKADAPSSITYTSRVIITLISHGYDNNNESLKSAVQWLKKQTLSLLQTKENIKHEYTECIEFRNRKLYFHHMPLQATLAALILSGNIKSHTVFDGVNELVEDNNGYYWCHPSFRNSNRKPLWAIFDTLMVCKALQEATYNWSSLKMIQSQGKHLTLTEASGPFSWEKFKQHFIYGKWGKCFIVICIGSLIFKIMNTFPQLSTATFVSWIIIPLIIELLGYYITETRKSKRKLG